MCIWIVSINSGRPTATFAQYSSTPLLTLTNMYYTRYLIFLFFGTLFIMGTGKTTPSPIGDVNLFQDNLEEQSLRSILVAIENRLKNLDSIYTTKLTPTLEYRLDQYQMKMDAIDGRLIRLESLVMLNLNRISENISSKNFKDDTTNTNINYKIDNVYEGLHQKLNYINRRTEHNLMKIQNKMDMTLSQLEKIDNTITTKDVDMEADISEALMAMDNLKSSYSLLEEMLSTNKNNEKTANIHNGFIDKIHEINNKLERLGNFTNLHNLEMEQNKILEVMKKELKEDLNNYAVKVADMGTDSGKSDQNIQKQLDGISKALNTSINNLQTGIFSIGRQIGKIGKITSGQVTDEILDTIGGNLKIIIENQEKFLEGCHRVQMDESQIESEISLTLEKLIDMIQNREEHELRDMKNIERMLRGHDNKITKGLSQANNNIINLYENTKTYKQSIDRDLQKICREIDALFFAILEASKSNNTEVNAILRELGMIKTRLNYVKANNQSHSIQDLNLIKTMLSEIKNATIKDEPNHTAYILQILQAIQGKLNEAQSEITNINTKVIDESIEKAFQKHLAGVEIVANSKLNYSEVARREKYIQKIFGQNHEDHDGQLTIQENEQIMAHTENDHSKHYVLDLIDVRANEDGPVETTTVNN